MLSNGRLTGSKVVRILSRRTLKGKNEGQHFISTNHAINPIFVKSRIKYDLAGCKHFLGGDQRMSFSTNVVALNRSNEGQKVVDYLLADVGEGITECEIVKWFVEPGSHVEEFDNLVEVQSDKASVEITSRYSGVVVEHCYQVGQVARVGSPLCRIRLEDGETEGTIEEKSEESIQSSNESIVDSSKMISNTIEEEHEPSKQKVSDGGRHATLATPAVRRLTRENGVQIQDVQGTGKDGRVTKDDVQQFINNRSGQSKQTERRTSELNTEMTNIPLSGVRKAMFKAMSVTWNSPHFGYSDEIDVTELDSIRQNLNKSNGQDQVRMTLLPFLLKAISITLNDHPLFRSTLNVEQMTLKQLQEHRISIAFASSRGLITPTLQGDVRSLSILNIANQINNLQTIGSNRGLNQSEMGTGSTITLSNIGSIGGTHTFPLIPPTGQLIIGAIGRTRILPRFDGDPKDGKVKASTILPVSFSADHRIVEGIELAKFVNDWKKLLENPTSWMLKMH